MATSAPRSALLLSKIPPPATVRARLGEALREVNMLRAMLRLSERAEKVRCVEAGQKRQAVHAP